MSTSMQMLQRFWQVTTAKPANIIVPMVLFYFLAPDNFVSIPGAINLIDFPISGPNRNVLLTHTLLLGFALAGLRYNFTDFY
jgi:hypothetical protein